MKIHQFRYVLFLLALTLFGVTLLVYSEEAAAGIKRRPRIPPEQLSEKSTSLETQDTEPEKEKQSPEPEPSPDASRELLKNLSSIYTMISRGVHWSGTCYYNFSGHMGWTVAAQSGSERGTIPAKIK